MAGARRLANEVRVGLEKTPHLNEDVVTSKIVHPLDTIWMGKPVRRHVQEFGAIFATLFLIIASVKAYRFAPVSAYGSWTAAALLIAATGYLTPSLLHPLWKGWMKFAHYLSIVMTFVLLSLVWCIGFLPMAGIVRLCGIRVIDKSYGTKTGTYWVKRDPKYDDFKRLKQQY